MDDDPDGGCGCNHGFLGAVPWVVLLLLIAFVLLNRVVAAQDDFGWLRTLTLGGLLVVTALWFIASFTGDASAKKDHAFVFAYAFTLGAFALLVTPFVSVEVPDAARGQNAVRPPEGVLQLIRGCVVADDKAAANTVSAVVRCPAASWAGDLPLPSVAVPASGPAAAASAPAVETDRQFAWLVAIGGATVRSFRPQLPGAAGRPAAFAEVHGGMVVPLFVVVLAFIGGAVSLSRRIPEYQRRSEKAYKPTEKDPPLADFEAREGVAFQVMQLVSAPFLAIASWYVFSPTTLATAATLAFGTGFASEHVLLMIRGLLEGLRPQSTPKLGSSPADAGHDQPGRKANI